MQVILATQNRGKVVEMIKILHAHGIDAVMATQPYTAEETGKTFEENAKIKAKACSEAHEGQLALADDSGIVVDALDGRPGVYSARYGKNDTQRNIKLLEELQGVMKDQRTARFECVMCLHQDGVDVCFAGTSEGMITPELRGKTGFGYDPIFIPEGYDKTFAELGSEVKNELSHRAKALEKVAEFLSK